MKIRVMVEQTLDVNEVELIKDLKMLNGIPPYDGPENYVRGDGYFANSFKEKYGASVDVLSKAVNFSDIINRWNKTREQFQ